MERCVCACVPFMTMLFSAGVGVQVSVSAVVIQTLWSPGGRKHARRWALGTTRTLIQSEVKQIKAPKPVNTRSPDATKIRVRTVPRESHQTFTPNEWDDEMVGKKRRQLTGFDQNAL